MDSEPFYPIEKAEKLISDFTDCSLPPSEWDHGGHLVLGLYLIAKYEDDAYEQVKKRLLNYLAKLGKDGYHETMTRFWIWAIRKYRGDENGKVVWAQASLDGIIFDDFLTRRNLWTEYYSTELMMSDAAKKTWLQADLKVMDYKSNKND